jgi:spore maturation protein CgeB
MKTGEEMLNLLNKAKIQFNMSVSVDVNYRNFETIGCGTCLLTNYLPELEELGFKDGVNCYMYKNFKEIGEKYNLAIHNWEKIAKEGEKLAKNHTYVKRVESLIKELTQKGDH